MPRSNASKRRANKNKRKREERREKTKIEGERPKDPAPFSENREEENRTIRSRKLGEFPRTSKVRRKFQKIPNTPKT